MTLALLVILLLGVALLLRLFLGETTASYILTLIGVLLAIFPGEVKILKSQAENLFAKMGLRKRLSLPFWFEDSFRFLDLSFLVTAILILLPAFFSTFDIALADMVDKGYIVFPKGSNGLYHLRQYAKGYLATPSLFAALALYGIYRGPRAKKIRLLSLCIATFVGVILAILLLAVLSGGWSGTDSLQEYLRRTNTTLPGGAAQVQIFLIFILLLLFCAALGFYTWIFAKIGSAISRGLRGIGNAGAEPRSRVDINTAGVEDISKALGVSIKVAQEIVARREKEPIVVAEDLLRISGIGRRTAERASAIFVFAGGDQHEN
jgi:competence ComEA-like helix-hairpin-helix protein